MKPLPRLLYIADVPVSDTRAGAQLLYRLLREYPREKLRVFAPRSLSGELAGVDYQTVTFGWPRLMRSRFARQYWKYLLWRAEYSVSALSECVRRFKPEAIVSVAHAICWVTAHRLARRHGIRVHLIVHDHVPSLIPWSDIAAQWEKRFAVIYRDCDTRLCISPQMESEYRRKYGVKGVVLYPGADPAVDLDKLPPLAEVRRGSLIFAYAGSATPGQAATILQAAKAISAEGHRFHIYLTNPDVLRRSQPMSLPGVRLEPPVRPSELRARLSEAADILLLPASFGAGDRGNTELLFPTKLTEYASAGLPLLVCGPQWSAIHQWAVAYGTAAGIASEDNEEALRFAVRTAALPERRRESGARFLTFARLHLAHKEVYGTFTRALTGC
jgi:hypothetical protein